MAVGVITLEQSTLSLLYRLNNNNNHDHAFAPSTNELANRDKTKETNGSDGGDHIIAAEKTRLVETTQSSSTRVLYARMLLIATEALFWHQKEWRLLLTKAALLLMLLSWQVCRIAVVVFFFGTTVVVSGGRVPYRRTKFTTYCTEPSTTTHRTGRNIGSK
jgi:hypothetical protein